MIHIVAHQPWYHPHVNWVTPGLIRFQPSEIRQLHELFDVLWTPIPDKLEKNGSLNSGRSGDTIEWLIRPYPV